MNQPNTQIRCATWFKEINDRLRDHENTPDAHDLRFAAHADLLDTVETRLNILEGELDEAYEQSQRDLLAHEADSNRLNMNDLASANVDAVIAEIQTELDNVSATQQTTNTMATAAQRSVDGVRSSVVSLSAAHNTLEESVRRLWAQQEEDDSQSQTTSSSPNILAVQNDQGAGTGVDPNFKPFFRQKLDPKEGTIAAFLTVY